MKTWRPQPTDADAREFELTSEEGFLLSRIDGSLSVEDLSDLTGIALDEVAGVISRLASQGLVRLEETVEPSLVKEDDGIRPWLGADSVPVSVSSASLVPTSEREAGRDEPEQSAPLDPTLPLDELDRDADADADEYGPEQEDEQPVEHERIDYRALYASDLRELTRDDRSMLAQKASGAVLMALCFDPEPMVINGVLDNSRSGLAHARLIAEVHRNAQGLEILGRHVELLRDGQVERRLLRNPQLPEVLLRRIISKKRLLQIYKLAVDHELPERTRAKTRGEFRSQFQKAEPDEQVDLLIRSEGRALAFLVGATFAGRTTQLLNQRTITSSLLVQNLARFPGTPPPVLARLLSLPFVKRQPQLRRMLLGHPNVPGDAKRRG